MQVFVLRIVLQLKAVLPVLCVLQPRLTCSEAECSSWVSISLTKFLHAEAAMSNHLTGDVAGCVHLHGDVNHVKRTPMFLTNHVID